MRSKVLVFLGILSAVEGVCLWHQVRGSCVQVSTHSQTTESKEEWIFACVVTWQESRDTVVLETSLSPSNLWTDSFCLSSRNSQLCQKQWRMKTCIRKEIRCKDITCLHREREEKATEWRAIWRREEENLELYSQPEGKILITKHVYDDETQLSHRETECIFFCSPFYVVFTCSTSEQSY